MSRWWRAYDEALHDPKLIGLSDRLHRAWFNLLCVASKNAGLLPAMNLVAIELRVSLHKAAEYVTALVAAGLIDEIETGKFAPHNWGRRQFQSDVSTDRVKRFRQRPRNVSSAVSETPPETETETEKKDAADAAPDPERELFARGKQVLGERAGGMIKNLLKAKNGDLALARAAVETASTKQNPREYIGGIVNAKSREGEFVWKSGIPGVL